MMALRPVYTAQSHGAFPGGGLGTDRVRVEVRKGLLGFCTRIVSGAARGAGYARNLP